MEHRPKACAVIPPARFAGRVSQEAFETEKVAACEASATVESAVRHRGSDSRRRARRTGAGHIASVRIPVLTKLAARPPDHGTEAPKTQALAARTVNPSARQPETPRV